MAEDAQPASAFSGTKMAESNGTKGYLAAMGTAFTILLGAATIGNIQLTQIKENAVRIETQGAADRTRIENQTKKGIDDLVADIDKIRTELRGGLVKAVNDHGMNGAAIAEIRQKFIEVETQFKWKDEMASRSQKETDRVLFDLQKETRDRAERWVPILIQLQERVEQLRTGGK